MLTSRTMSAIRTPSLQKDQLGSAESHGDRISAILDRDNATKGKLLEIYNDLKKFLFTDPDNILDEEIEAHYRNYKVSLDKFPKDLMGSERPIIFTGETSAGKSSLLNLLLGFDILPTSTLPSTGVICRLRTSYEKKAEIFYKSGSKCDTVYMENGDEKAFSDMLRDKICPKENREFHNIQYVDLYWPIPFLRKNMIVVDTPGVGESDEMTSRLKEYLPNAVALVYVIDSTRGGGIQGDRIVPLLKIFSDHASDAGLKSKFDPACAMFILNKWDMVDDYETEEVKNFIKTKLAKYWPRLQERQMYCLSTKKALSKKKKGKPLPDSYFEVRCGIEQLVEVSLVAKSRQHKIWIQTFLSTIRNSLQAHIQLSRRDEDHQKRQLQKVEQLLTKLEDTCVNDKARLKKEKEQKCKRLSGKVYEHLKDERNWDKMFLWRNHTLPDKGDDLSNIKAQAFKLIQSIVVEEFSSCLDTKGGTDIMNEMVEKVVLIKKAIHKDRCSLERTLQNPDMEDDGNCKEGEEEEMTEQELDDSILTKGEIATIAVTSPIWFPLALVGGLVVVPVVAAVVAIKDKFQVAKYRRNKTEYLQKWSKEYMDELSERTVSTWVENAVFSTFNEKLDDFFDVELSQTINGFKKLFANLKNERRDSGTIRKYYQPKVDECERIIEKLNAITTDAV